MLFETSEFVQDATCCLFSIFIFLHHHCATGLQKVGTSIFNKVGDCGATGISIALLLQWRREIIYDLDFR
jgi:hypothetical protein